MLFVVLFSVPLYYLLLNFVELCILLHYVECEYECRVLQNRRFVSLPSAGDLPYTIQLLRCNKRDASDISAETGADACVNIQQHEFLASEIRTSERVPLVTEPMESSSAATGRPSYICYWRYVIIVSVPYRYIIRYDVSIVVSYIGHTVIDRKIWIKTRVKQIIW